MNKFIIQGDLLLGCQEGSYAQDGWELTVSNLDGSSSLLQLDDLVARHFGVEREWPSGDRRIGMVQITIERLDG
jgi:hypothetical protein